MPVEFFPTDPKTIETRVKAAFDNAVTADGELLYPNHQIPGTPGYNQRKITERLLLQDYLERNAVYTNMSPRTAEGAGISDWASYFSLPRKEGENSTGKVIIRASQTGTVLESLLGTRSLAANTQLTVGTAVIALEQDAVIPTDGTTVEVAVKTLGASRSNIIPKATRLSLNNHPLKNALTIEVSEEISGGFLTETDAQLRYRLIKALRDPSSPEGFEVTLLSDTDVSTVDLVESKYGPGTVEAFVTPAVSFPPSSLRTRLENLYQGPGRAYVIFPDYQAVALRIRIGTGVTPSKSIIVDYINNLGAGSTVILSQLESLLLNAGVSDAQVLQIRLGEVTEEGNLTDPRTLATATNFTPDTTRSKWYTKPEWITFCQ